jgi:hypothetical protein
MKSPETQHALAALFTELTAGPPRPGAAFILNSGDPGLLGSLDRLSHVDASQSVEGGATVAAHVQHVRYGLSLMNKWATEGGNPFADATWDVAWRTSAVDESQWAAERAALRDEAARWREILDAPRELHTIELTGMISSVAHLAYHLGAIRQIAKSSRGPRDGTFT